jgi:hypothetical protein
LAASCSVFINQFATSQLEIFIWLEAMQYKIPKFINSLHAARDQLNEILHPAGGQPDANFVEISGKHIAKLLMFCKHTWTTFKKK